MVSVLAEVLPVGNNARARLPVVSYNGTEYVIAEPGTEWELCVRVPTAKKNQRYRFGVKLDGKCIGYSMTQLCSSSRLGCEMVFHGFGRTDPLTGMIAYRAFKFGALTPAACAATVEHPDQIQAGRIEVTCEAVVKTGQGTGKHRDAGWAADAASKKLPEGKKWFLQPGLQAEEGSTVKQTNQGWGCALYSVLYPLPVLRLRYDTADNLRLRKILNPSNPQHAAILARASSTGVAGSSSASRQPKQEHRAAGVKRERSSPGQQQQRQAAGAGGAGLPRSATAETINLVDDAPAPLRVCGRVLAADELAVCDLAGSDDEGEPAWQVQKKQAIELAV